MNRPWDLKKIQIILHSGIKEKFNASQYIPSCTREVTVNINFTGRLPEDNIKRNNIKTLPKLTLGKEYSEVDCYIYKKKTQQTHSGKTEVILD